jgi:putative transposase
MPRNARCILPENPYHITQRGTNRQRIFFSARDRRTYLDLLRSNIDDAGVRILAYCLMPNHVHLIAVPERPESLGVLLRRVHGRFAQSVNLAKGRTGHLFQNRFYSCPLSTNHLWTAIRYVERNPVRALLVSAPEQYRWSSAAAHLVTGSDKSGSLDMDFWAETGGGEGWRDLHAVEDEPEKIHLLRRCTYCGRPFGAEAFIRQLEDTFRRSWRRWAFESTLTDSPESRNHTTAPSPSHEIAG